jgi:hypothetical protein
VQRALPEPSKPTQEREPKLVEEATPPPAPPKPEPRVVEPSARRAPPAAPVKTSDPLDALEEEMAKLLGRPPGQG